MEEGQQAPRNISHGGFIAILLGILGLIAAVAVITYVFKPDPVSACIDLGEPSQTDNCLLQAAEDEIESVVIQDICSFSSDEDKQKKCLERSAIKTGIADLCDGAKDPDNCFLLVAKENADKNTCERIGSDTDADFCIYVVATENYDISMCRFIDNDIRNDSCFNFFCDDSDGGKHYFEKGFVNSFGEEPVEDSCSVEGGKRVLTEYYCTEGAKIKSVRYDCANQCINGACVDEPNYNPQQTTSTSDARPSATISFKGDAVVRTNVENDAGTALAWRFLKSDGTNRLTRNARGELIYKPFFDDWATVELVQFYEGYYQVISNTLTND